MTPLTDIARKIFQQALADCDVEAAMAGHISAENGLLHIGNESFKLESLRGIRIVAAGKAANGMLRGLWRQFPSLPRCDIAGVLISPERPSWLQDQFQYFAGGHPFPNAASFAGALAALNCVRDLHGAPPTETLCIFLISGGSSAMMELPLDPNISLADTTEFHRTLVASGVSIAEMNCVRKHFSAVKGGRLALAAGDSIPQRTFLVSDVPKGHEDTLGSGPSLPDSSDSDECCDILDRFGLLPQFPAAIGEFFGSKSLPETPKPNELQASFQVILSSRNLAEAAASCAQALGFRPVIDNTCDEWEYREAANYLIRRLRTLRRENCSSCLISVGEIAVKLPAQGMTGTGGRNQQFALHAATLLQHEDRNTTILSAGSDGIDGNSPAAGGVVDVEIFDNPNCDRKAAITALANFEAYRFLRKAGAVVATGATGNNVRDLRLLLVRD